MVSDPTNPCDPSVLAGTCQNTEVTAKVFLQAAYVNTTGMMNDVLRDLGYLPTVEPYSNISTFDHQNGGEITSLVVFGNYGNNSIVDWVYLELRDEDDPSVVVATRAALVQRDGDIVDMDGVSPVNFATMPGNYYLAVRHRNHIGAMTAQPVNFAVQTPPVIDFTDAQTPTWGTDAQRIQGNHAMLWGGNSNSDNQLIFQGAVNDVDPPFFVVLFDANNVGISMNHITQGYNHADMNMDGNTIFQGDNNDLSIIFFNVLQHPANPNILISTIIYEQLP